MPAPVQDFISPLTSSQIRVGLEPAQNVIHSLVLLARVKHYSGLNEWVEQTARDLTPEETLKNNLVVVGFYYAIVPEQSWTSFPAYLDHLAALSPGAIQDKLLDTYARIPVHGGDEGETCNSFLVDTPVYNKANILSSPDSYLAFLRQHFDEAHVDADLEAQAYRYVIDPPALKALIVSHLHEMWEKYLSPEWERVKPMLKQAVNAFQQIDFTRMSRLEAARLVTGQELGEVKWKKWLEETDQVIFTPSAHVGPYLGSFHANRTLWILFGARLPEGIQANAPDLSRAEIIVHLSALADDNRLRILKYIAEHGEQRAQDLIQLLDLSQSAASRHLSQLSATGYLSERRCDGAKCYALNPERLENTLKGVSAFLLGNQKTSE